MPSGYLLDPPKYGNHYQLIAPDVCQLILARLPQPCWRVDLLAKLEDGPSYCQSRWLLRTSAIPHLCSPPPPTDTLTMAKFTLNLIPSESVWLLHTRMWFFALTKIQIPMKEDQNPRHSVFANGSENPTVSYHLLYQRVIAKFALPHNS